MSNSRGKKLIDDRSEVDWQSREKTGASLGFRYLLQEDMRGVSEILP